MLYRRATVGIPYRRPRFHRHHFFGVLRHSVGVLRVRDALGRPKHLDHATAHRAGQVPSRLLERGFGPHVGRLLTVIGADVETLAHRRLRRGDHDPTQVEPLGNDDLVQQRRRGDVDVGERGEVGEVVLVGGEVVDGVHPAQEVGDEIAVADVADEEFDAGGEIVGLAVAMYGGGQRVQHDHVVAESDQTIAGVGSDEPGSTGNQDSHRRRPRRGRREWTSRYTARVRSAVAAHVNSPARTGP